MYTRKTVDEFEVQGNYGAYGWECVTTEETRRAAIEQLRTYRLNDPRTSYRIAKKRVKKEDN